MLDKQDIALLEGMFARHTVHFKEILDQNNHDLKREIRDEMHSLLAALKTEFKTEIAALKVEIITGVTDLIDDGILPQIDDLRADMIVVKEHLKLA